MALLEINALCAEVGGQEILRGINLQLDAGRVHAIMGPNGSGKSTLSYVLSGRDGYQVTGGSVLFGGKNLLEMNPEERAREGVFLGFQYPVEIPGVPGSTFLKTAVNAVRRHRGESEFDAIQFVKFVRAKAQEFNVTDDMLKRSVNSGFSGGEKKRIEILQMALLEPRLAILDETDSGLDIDALKLVADGVNAMRSPDRAMLMITHYQRLLDFVVPDVIHVLFNGQIVKSGPKELALELEQEGYGQFFETAA